MKLLQILLFSLLLISCSKSNVEIDAVISEVIQYDSLRILKNDSTIVFRELKKLHISTYNKNDIGISIIVPVSGRTVYVENLLFMSVNKKMLFTKKDSAYIMRQDKSKTKNLIPKAFEKRIVTTLDSLIYKKQNVEYYEIFAPIFSKDKLKAYTEINYRNKRFGCGFAFLLEKINGKWKVIQTRSTWIT